MFTLDKYSAFDLLSDQLHRADVAIDGQLNDVAAVSLNLHVLGGEVHVPGVMGKSVSQLVPHRAPMTDQAFFSSSLMLNTAEMAAV